MWIRLRRFGLFWKQAGSSKELIADGDGNKTDYLNLRFYVLFCLIFFCTKCFCPLSVHPKMKRIIRKTLKQELLIESGNAFVLASTRNKAHPSSLAQERRKASKTMRLPTCWPCIHLMQLPICQDEQREYSDNAASCEPFRPTRYPEGQMPRTKV